MGKGKEFWSEYGPSMLSAGGSLFGALGNIASTVLRNRAQMRETKYRNEMQRQESERAYEVSKPIHQVQQMRDAGLSKAGALNALNGGASYSPAPMESAKLDAPNIDLSHMFDGMMTVHENSKQRKLQDYLVGKQIQAAKDNLSSQLESAKENLNAQIISDEKKHRESLKTQKEIAELQANTTNRNADRSLALAEREFNEVTLPESKKRIDKIQEDTRFTKEQREHFKELRPILKENAQEEVTKVKEEIKSIKSVRDLDVRRFALEKIKVHLENYFGTRLYELRSSLKYWESKPETLYKGLGWRGDSLEDLDSIEDEMFQYLQDLAEVLDELDKLESNYN